MIWLLILTSYLASSNAIIPSKELRISLSSSCNDVSRTFATEYKKFMRTGLESPKLKSLTGQMKHTKAIQRTEIENLSIDDQSFLCTACYSAATVMIEMANEPHSEEDEKNDTDEQLAFFALEMCTRLNIQPEHVCEGLIELNLPILIYIARHSNVTAEGLCGTILQGSSCVLEEPEYNWQLNIEPNGPKVNDHKTDIPAPSQHDLNILHLTDIHYDPHYQPGALAACDEPLCCIRKVDNIPDELKAGAWGDYRDCDVSWDLYVSSLEHIKNEHKTFDYIYYTGDIIEHAVWKTNENSIKKSLHDVYDKLKNVFGDIPIFPLIGNHESQPLNVFAPPNVRDRYRTQWLYDFLYEEWSKWLPADTKLTINQGGYYTVSPKPGFRIIALNNNDCYSFNWWIFYNPGHLSVQLQWLHDVLLKAEQNNEYVHILAHVPSGTGSCLNTWAREFRRVVERYHHIISGIFNGHTHFDEFNVFYSIENPKYAINIGWNGGSLTPFSEVNPNYRTYKIEPQTYQVVNHETYIFNLTEANLTPNEKPKWFKEYSFAETFGLNDLSAASLHELLEKFTKDPALLHKYWEYKKKQGDPEMKRGCDNECLSKHLCEIATTQFNDLKRCEELQRAFEQTIICGNESGGSTNIIASTLLTIIFISINVYFH